MKSLWKWRNQVWYFLATYIFLAGVIQVISGDLWQTITGTIYIIVGGGFLWYLIRGMRRYRKSGVEPYRLQLLMLLRLRTVTPESFWLNRDKHLIFHAYRKGRMFKRIGVVRADEDQARYLELGGRTALTSEVFEITPVVPNVTHYVYGVMGVMNSDGEAHIEKPPVEKLRWWRYLSKYMKMSKTGLMYAGAEDLKELIAQFEGAEPINPDVWDD